MNWFLELIAAWFGRKPLPAPTPTPVPQPVPAPVPAPQPRPPGSALQLSALLVNAINTERSRAGLSPMVDDIPLTSSASSWATSMAIAGRESHDNFLERVGSVYPDRPIGEIVAEGFPDIASVMAGWMSSPPHRGDILGDYDRAGGGMATNPSGTPYWCVQFAKVG